MKWILAIMVIFALALPSQAAMWDVGKIITGDNVIPSEGGPWVDDEGKIYFGEDKDFAIGYENAYDKLFINGTNAGLYFNSGGDITFYTGDPTNDSIDFGTYPITAAGLTGFTNTNYGLNESGGKAGINLSADMGLAFDTDDRLGALKVKNGDGIDLGSAGVEVDVGDLIGDGIRESTSPANNFEVNVTGYKGLEIGTGANESELMVEVDSGLQLTSDGVGVMLSDTSLTAAGIGMSITPGAFQMDIIGGGTAGNFTLTGAANGDEVIGVTYFNATTGNVTAVVDLTSEFSIPDTNILNQTYGGTSSLNGYLQVFWMDRTD